MMLEQLKAWARKYNDQGRYTPVGIAFHWIMAAMILFQVGWGFYISLMGVGGDKIAAYEVHSAVGLPILILAIGRFAWRSILLPGPINDADKIEGVQALIAHFTVIIFYISFFALPLSGWIMWSSVTSPGPLYLGGILPWPELPLESLSVRARLLILDGAEDVHEFLVWMLVFIVPLHVGAALMHHFWLRHDVLSAMLPEIPDFEAPRGEPPRTPR
jgi:cytochrome b561